MTEFQSDVFSLIKSAVLNIPVTINRQFDWNKAVNLGLKHKILPLLYYGAHNSGIVLPSELEENLLILVTKYFAASEYQLNELKKITESFDEKGIDYMPLKGSVLKRYYPAPELRPMGDIDILIKLDQYSDISDCMVELGYYEERISDHELNWFKNETLVELHKRLIPSYNTDFYNYFEDGWKLAVLKQGKSNVYELSSENMLIYLFTHFSKHYRDAGIGILHLVDLFVYMRRFDKIDTVFVESELNKLGLLKFYKNILKTIEVCFNGSLTNDIVNRIIERIFDSGSYGSQSAQILSTTVKKTKNVKHKKMVRFTLFFKRVFMPYGEMCRKYKVLKRFPFLLPFFWIYRIFTVLFFKRSNITNEIHNLKESNPDAVLDYYEDLKYVGLDFNFDE